MTAALHSSAKFSPMDDLLLAISKIRQLAGSPGDSQINSKMTRKLLITQT